MADASITLTDVRQAEADIKAIEGGTTVTALVQALVDTWLDGSADDRYRAAYDKKTLAEKKAEYDKAVAE